MFDKNIKELDIMIPEVVQPIATYVPAKKIDNLLDKGRGELDPVKRKKMYVEAHQILAEDIPMLALYGTKWLWTYNEKLDGFPIGYTFRDGLETVNWDGKIPSNRK